MSQYFIDTSSIINYLRNDPSIVSLVEKLNEDLTSSYICLSELYEGVYRVKNKDKAEQGLIDFFKGLSEIYGVDSEIAKTFAQIRIDLKKKGEIIEDLDILIAATCISNNLSLITLNMKHFKKITGLKFVKW